MLIDISIDNLGTIQKATAEFAPGLTVLTGETGAGKTMVVTGLRLLAGGRADASRVRQGSDKAAVEGRFDAALPAALDVVQEAGGEADENGEIIATRTLTAAGRSRAYLGGRAVPAAKLGEFATHLLTVHGQNDQLRLMAPEQQLGALDRSEDGIGSVAESYREAFVEWRTLAKDYATRTERRRELAQEADRLNFGVGEIDAVDPQTGEDEELVGIIRRLQDVDALREAAGGALAQIDGADAVGAVAGAVAGAGDEGAAALLGQAQAALESSSDKQLQELGAQLADITSQLGDISAELGSYVQGLDTDPEALEKSLQRQQELKQLTRKYAADIAGVIAWRDEANARLASMDTSTEALEALKAKVKDAEADMIAKAAELTKARKAAAAALGKAVTAELKGLAMGSSTFGVEVRPARYSKAGADEVEFQLNGRPLAGSASGGELSRVMLALEVVLAANVEGQTMVFDEVDAGVGGRAAVEIGRRLARLAVRNQVIVVTHLPQVAAFADAHLHVAKELYTSGVQSLSPEARVEELARMLAGLDGTDTGRAHAQELFDRAQAEVESFRAPSAS